MSRFKTQTAEVTPESNVNVGNIESAGTANVANTKKDVELQPKSVYRTVGSVRIAKTGDTYLSFGESLDNPEFATSVTITIRDSSGKILSTLENPALYLQDPRQYSPNIPEFIKFRIRAKL